MKLFNEKVKNQKFVTTKGDFVSDKDGYMDVDDKGMAKFFKDQGWEEVGKTKKAEPKKEEPKKIAEEPEVESEEEAVEPKLPVEEPKKGKRAFRRSK